jgi:hypothetical protein
LTKGCEPFQTVFYCFGLQLRGHTTGYEKNKPWKVQTMKWEIKKIFITANNCVRHIYVTLVNKSLNILDVVIIIWISHLRKIVHVKTGSAGNKHDSKRKALINKSWNTSGYYLSIGITCSSIRLLKDPKTWIWSGNITRTSKKHIVQFFCDFYVAD